MSSLIRLLDVALVGCDTGGITNASEEPTTSVFRMKKKTEDFPEKFGTHLEDYIASYPRK
jgi:hypothetical protein